MEHSERVQTRMEQMALLLVYDLQKIFGKLDKETFEYVQYTLYCSFRVLADEVSAELLQGSNNATQSSESQS